MTAAANPYRSKYKPGDPVVFTHAGPNFQRTATIHTVRKDGALIVHFDDDPPRSILVVQPYEIGPTATTTFAPAENPLPEPWDAAENPTTDLRSVLAGLRVKPGLHWSGRKSIGDPWAVAFLYDRDHSTFALDLFFKQQSKRIGLTKEDVETRGKSQWLTDNVWRLTPSCIERVAPGIEAAIRATEAKLGAQGGPAENPRGPHDLHARIAAALNWPLRDVQSVSLQSLRDLVRPVSIKLADEISRVVQSAGHYVHTGVETSPTERQILDFLLTGADDVDRGTFSRASTEEVAAHFQITPEVAYKRMNALAKRGVITKSRDIIKGRGGKKVVGYQLWEYAWKDGDEARAEQIEAARRAPAGNPMPVEHTEDADCTVGPDGTCTVCGVSHTGQCVCGGRGFHRPGCPEVEAVPVAKPGPHGELLRYTVYFRDPGKPAFDGEERWGTWAYSIEHAVDLFREQHDGFQVVRTELEVEVPAAENPRRAPSKKYGDIEWRWENEGSYRAFVGGQPTEWLGTRNDNEPPSSSLRWSLLRGNEIEPYTELGSLEAISGALGRMLARGVFTR